VAIDSDFLVRNGLVVNNFVLYANASTARIGINNNAPDATLTITGTANVSANVNFGQRLNVTGPVVFANSLTGPGVTTALDGFLIDCGTFS